MLPEGPWYPAVWQTFRFITDPAVVPLLAPQEIASSPAGSTSDYHPHQLPLLTPAHWREARYAQLAYVPPDLVPALQHVLLLKLHDEPGLLNRRLHAWVVVKNALPGAPPQIQPGVEFGSVDAAGAARAVWVPGGGVAPPILPLPPIPAGPGVGVGPVLLDLSEALETLRAAGGYAWMHGPPP